MRWLNNLDPSQWGRFYRSDVSLCAYQSDAGGKNPLSLWKPVWMTCSDFAGKISNLFNQSPPQCGDQGGRGHDEDAGGAVEDGAEVAEGGEGVALGRDGAGGRRELSPSRAPPIYDYKPKGFQMLH